MGVLKFLELDPERLRLLYTGEQKSVAKVAEILGVCRTQVDNALRRHGIQVRRRGPVPTYVSDISCLDPLSPDGAYLLGLLWSDGNLTKNLATVRLTMTDRDVIEFVTSLMRSGREVRLIPRRQPSHKDQFEWTSGGKKLIELLVGFGLHPNKSKTVRAPMIAKSLHSHFVRGFIDGDGSWYFASCGRPSLRLGLVSASPGMLEDILNWFPPTKMRTVHKHGGAEAWTLSFAERDAIAIGNWVYATNHFGMARKYEVYREGCRRFLHHHLEQMDRSSWARSMTEFTRCN
jgi:hypothetical protein